MALAAALVLSIGGCAMVKVSSLGPRDYIAMKRGDVLSSGKLGDVSQETLRVAGIEPAECVKDVPVCTGTLLQIEGLGDERRLSALAEIWTQRAIGLTPKDTRVIDDAALTAWLEAARNAYAYLFFTQRSPGERVFEDRQTQVRDYYNYAVQEVATQLFVRWKMDGGKALGPGVATTVGDWQVVIDSEGLRLPGDITQVETMVPASTLRFVGLRSTYRRDGFGAELVAEMPAEVVGDVVVTPVAATTGHADLQRADSQQADRPRVHRHAPSAFSEMPFAPVSVLVRFEGETLEDMLYTRRAVIEPHDPYRVTEIDIGGQTIPLAANFTAGYGLWLARSGFADQALRSMLGRERGIDRAHLYLMQPYDPQRRIVLMLHGLGSSPEAWVNVANELSGDRQLRQHYQVWQVYYPTNMPIAWNQAQIRKLVTDTLTHFDPGGRAAASQHMVLVGHSMGGVIARLLVSTSGDQLSEALLDKRRLEGERGKRVRRRLQPLLHFEPLPHVDRAVFIAAPHRGTPAANGRIGRLIGRLVRLPITVLEQFGEVLQDLAEGQGDGDGSGGRIVPNSIDNLRDTDPFVRAAADLPISPRVRYHTIVGQDDMSLPLIDSSDGVVPYRSAHLEGAESEKVIESWHSVQETPQAILEIRRILHKQLRTEP
ncbi:MAG TPA: alpha/beta hydrolase [Lysobacter sp.]|nr:alpha/beta hydrolase [Lysobacter sp.]